MAIPDRQWDLIVGVHRLSSILRLPELREFYDRMIGDALSDADPNSKPDELYNIAVQALKWGSNDLADIATKRL
ncbi:hypothetical protein HDU93_004545, partial [Gonapodya sp. JEL0774]